MDDQVPARAFLEAAERLWPECQGFHRVVIDGTEIGAVCLEDIDEEAEVMLSLVKVRRGFLGQGNGSRILDAVCELADRHGVALQAEIVPTGRLDEAGLVAWYARRGFERVTDPVGLAEGPPMNRSPNPDPTPGPG